MSPYQRYLKSDHWQALRLSRLKLAKWLCEDCRCNQRLEVHHLLYRTPWEAGVIEDVIVLCAWCHAERHNLRPPKYPRGHAPKKKRKSRPRNWRYRQMVDRIRRDARSGNTQYIIFPHRGAVSPAMVTVGPLIEPKPQPIRMSPSRGSRPATSKYEELPGTGFTADLTPAMPGPCSIDPIGSPSQSVPLLA